MQGVNHPVTMTGNSKPESATNVNELFLKILILGLIVNILTATSSVWTCCRPNRCLSCDRVFQALVFISNLLFLSLVTVVRFSHTGKVCTGDYMHYSEAEDDDTILRKEGQFLIVYICVGWIQVAILLAVLFLSKCFSRGKYSPDKERDS